MNAFQAKGSEVKQQDKQWLIAEGIARACIAFGAFARLHYWRELAKTEVQQVATVWFSELTTIRRDRQIN